MDGKGLRGGAGADGRRIHSLPYSTTPAAWPSMAIGALRLAGTHDVAARANSHDPKRPLVPYQATFAL